MAKTYLDVKTVHHNFETYGYDNVLNELNRAGDEEQKRLLENFPDSFPFLYAIRSRHMDGDVTFNFQTRPAQRDEIVTEAEDVRSNTQELSLDCNMLDAGKFSISVKPYDRVGDEHQQLSARINFPQQTIEHLNAQRLKKILEFCEQHGFSVWGIELPYRDGVIDIDEKLGCLTKELLEEHNKSVTEHYAGHEEYQELPDPMIPLQTKMPKKSKQQTLDNIREEFLNLLEKDMHCMRGLTYFEHRRKINGRTAYEFSIYDKPDKNNEKNDGRRDKDGVPVPTYRYRLYVSQDADGKFNFAYSVPHGKKIDDAMAGDLIGIIKKTGATHINFSNLNNAEKGVWLTACAEKGIVPIGISINVAKAKSMVESAKKKLTDEELRLFKRNLADQMIENAAAKNKDAPNYGLSKSEMAYISSLRAGYQFENFRLAYEDDNGLFAAVNQQIDRGSRDKKEGAAITFGGMQTLRTVFDIYIQYQNQTFGDYLNAPQSNSLMSLTDEEREKLREIPSNKPMTQLDTADFMLIYNTLLPRHIEKNKADIIQALERENTRKTPKRAENVVISADLFPRIKGDIIEINTILTRNMGIEALTLPTEHKGLTWMGSNANNQPSQAGNSNSGAAPGTLNGNAHTR